MVVQRRVLRMQRLGDVHRVLRPLDHLLHVAQQQLAVGRADMLVHASGHRAGAVHPLARRDANHLLPVLAQQHALLRDVGVGRGHADDVATIHFAVEAEQQVRAGQVEEMQRVALHYLAVVHQPADLVGRGRDRRRADHMVQRLARRQVVRHRADAAQPLHHHRHLPVGPALDELLEAAEFDDVQPHLLHLVLRVEQDRHLAVTLDTRHRVDGDTAQAVGDGGRRGGLERSGHGFQS